MSLGSGIRDPRSGIRNKPIPGVKRAPIPDPGSGSATLLKKVEKQKPCRPPKHIGEKIGGQYVKMYVENHAL